AGKLGEEKKFSEAEAVLDRYPAIAKEVAAFRNTQAWLYNKWAVELWNKEDWEGALSKFEKQITLNEKVRIALEKVRQGLGGTAEVSVDGFSLIQLEELKTYLKAAMQTREHLKQLGQPPVMDGTLKAIFSVLAPTTTNKSVPSMDQGRQQLIAVIQAYKAQK
ncbi:MAG: hypothetical protein V4760_18765, partial [Bdellovibrionota bacterium]